jgi:hypothetical protein
MRHDPRWGGLVVASVVAAMLGCGRDDTTARSQLLDAAAARRLVGTWDASFRLDPEQSVTVYARPTTPVAGTLVFAEDHYGHISTAELSGPTHDGVYDVDFRPFGFSTRDAGAVPVAVARVAPAGTVESLYVVLSPGTPRFAVRMVGTIAGDSAAGVWRATAFSAGGGGGSFTMRRRRDAP